MEKSQSVSSIAMIIIASRYGTTDADFLKGSPSSPPSLSVFCWSQIWPGRSTPTSNCAPKTEYTPLSTLTKLRYWRKSDVLPHLSQPGVPVEKKSLSKSTCDFRAAANCAGAESSYPGGHAFLPFPLGSVGPRSLSPLLTHGVKDSYLRSWQKTVRRSP